MVIDVAVTINRRKTLFPGKENTSLSMNLTALGRQLLKELAGTCNVSINDFVEALIREKDGLPVPRLPEELRRTGPKGGAKSFFFGKVRGQVTAILFTPFGRQLLDEQVRQSGMSRGDYIEYLLREKQGCS